MIGEGVPMRTFLIATLATVVLAAPADAATRNFSITSFTKVRVEGPYKVSVATGVAPFASASGAAAALDRVAIDVRGDTLVVHNAIGSWGGYRGQDPGPVEIKVGSHDLGSAWLVGSGTMAIDRVRGLTFNLSLQGSGAARIGAVDVDQLGVSLAGSSDVRLAGQALKLTATVRGISSLDAAALSVKDATIAAEGAATIKANVGNSATIGASGPATIELAGRPACTLHTSGSTTVSGCR
ncbi:MAG: DUF2807 domain-containing protein [Pseudomonadota bacterium]